MAGETPRTDDLIARLDSERPGMSTRLIATANLARQLERDLQTERAARLAAEAKVSKCPYGYERANEGLMAGDPECRVWKHHAVDSSLAARAERAEASAMAWGETATLMRQRALAAESRAEAAERQALYYVEKMADYDQKLRAADEAIRQLAKPDQAIDNAAEG